MSRVPTLYHGIKLFQERWSFQKLAVLDPQKYILKKKQTFEGSDPLILLTPKVSRVVTFGTSK